MHRQHFEWVPKGVLCDLARDSDLHATGEHTGRRLRELVEEGELEVKLIKNHAHYRAKPKFDWASYNKEALAMFEA